MKKHKISKESFEVLNDFVDMLEREAIVADYKGKKFIKMNTKLVLWQVTKLRNILDIIKGNKNV